MNSILLYINLGLNNLVVIISLVMMSFNCIWYYNSGGLKADKKTLIMISSNWLLWVGILINHILMCGKLGVVSIFSSLIILSGAALIINKFDFSKIPVDKKLIILILFYIGLFSVLVSKQLLSI